MLRGGNICSSSACYEYAAAPPVRRVRPVPILPVRARDISTRREVTIHYKRTIPDPRQVTDSRS